MIDRPLVTIRSPGLSSVPWRKGRPWLCQGMNRRGWFLRLAWRDQETQTLSGIQAGKGPFNRPNRTELRRRFVLRTWCKKNMWFSCSALLRIKNNEEFYEVQDVSLNLEEHNQQLARYEYDHNHIRPHCALELKSTIEYYVQWKKIHKANVSPMS